jgi:hypothetical protein
MDICPDAARRTEAARHLIDRAQDEELVDLAVLSAMDLCVLGGPRHPLFDEDVARAWSRLGGRQRDKFTEAVTESMLQRGLLLDEGLRTSAQPLSGSYALKPELGLALAARCRPSFIVVTEAEHQRVRGLRLFALGDEAEPVRGLVLEAPAGPLPDRERDSAATPKLGPLGWIYRYALVSRQQAAEVLARWTLSPPRGPGGNRPGGYLVSVYQPGQGNCLGTRVRVRGNGASAQVNGPGEQDLAERDLAGLRAVMLGLLTGPFR